MANRNPLSFIADLLNNPGLSLADRQRIKELASRTARFGILPDELTLENKENSIFHRPKEMVSFLYNFSKDDTLKWFAHSYDIQEFDYANQMKSASKLLTILHSKYKSINPSTWMLVFNYVLNSKSNWWVNSEGKRENYNWQSPELSSWCAKNAGKHPALKNDKENGLVFDNGTLFSDIYQSFKHSIRFRTDDKNLTFYKRLKAIVKNKLSQDFKIDYSMDLREHDVDLYIDVRRLFAAIEIVFEWISENKAKGANVSFDLKEGPDTVSLIVFHKGTKLSATDKKLEGLDGDWANVRSLLFSVADWTVEADRTNEQSVRIVCLNDNTIAEENGTKASVRSKNILEPLPVEVGGVRHIFTLYRNV